MSGSRRLVRRREGRIYSNDFLVDEVAMIFLDPLFEMALSGDQFHLVWREV